MSLCHACKTELPAAARFCLSCGSPQDLSLKTKVVQARQEIERERKFVCILFGDISGFTSLSEKMDPEAVTELMSAAFERLGAVVVRYDGYIDKFIGDCIMALFGAPFAHEDDPQRAVSCALAMQSELENFNRERHLNLKMRIGINSGIVIAGGMGAEGKFEYTVMGDAVNIAERVQSAAKPGETLITQNVSRLAERAFELKDLPAIHAKGKSAPIPVFAVQSARLVEIPRETIHQGYSKLAGRALEMQAIEEVIDLAANSKGQMLILQGEAGVGKSRLLHEAKKKALRADFHWIEAPCNGITRETPFATFLRITKQINAIEKTAKNLTAEEETLLHEIVSNEGIPLQGSQALERKRVYFEFFKRIILFGLATKKTAIVIEDMHWMDASSRELLLEIQEECKDSSLVILGASREDQNGFHSLNLHPLSNEDCRMIIKSLLKIEEIPESIWDLVQSKSDGNPLYVEELIKSLIDTKKLIFEKGSWVMKGNPDSESVPNSLQALIASRIDRLPKLEKKILQLASVIGRVFSDKLLQQTGDFGDQLFEALRHLRRRELIFEYASDGEKIIYIFKHALTQDVSYESLLFKRRKEFHASVAKSLETDTEIVEDKLELLAHHFLRAENRQKAINYLSLCARKSAAAYDNDRAIKFLKSAIQLMEAQFAETKNLDTGIFELIGRLDDIYQIQGLLEEAELVLLRQVFLSQSHEHWNILAQAYGRLGDIARLRSHYDLAMDWHKKSLDLAQKYNDKTNEVQTLKAIGTVYYFRGDDNSAMKYYEEALGKVAATKNIKLEAELWNDIGNIHCYRKSCEKAEFFLNRCFEICSAFEELKEMKVIVLLNLGYTKLLKTEFTEGIRITREAADLAQKIGNRTNLLTALQNLGALLMKQGRADEAIHEFNAIIEIATKLKDDEARIRGATLVAIAKAELKQLPQAIEIFEQARSESLERKIWVEFWRSSHFLAQTLEASGDADKALHILETTQMRLETHADPALADRCRNERNRMLSLNKA